MQKQKGMSETKIAEKILRNIKNRLQDSEILRMRKVEIYRGGAKVL